jgi:hypothetical protein
MPLTKKGKKIFAAMKEQSFISSSFIHTPKIVAELSIFWPEMINWVTIRAKYLKIWNMIVFVISINVMKF